MVPVSSGNGGVNWFYALYRFDKAAGRFRAVGPEEFCNPEARPAERILVTPCRSGPAWLDDAFQFAGDGRPYKYRENEVIALRGFERDNAVTYLRRFRDADGRVARSEVIDPGEDKPAVRKIPVAQVYLYTAPDDAARTTSYIIQGDVVELLDVEQQPGQRQWLQIAYQSARVGRMVRWIRLE